LNLVHPDDQPKFKRHWQSHAHRQQSDEMEFRILDREGVVHWVHHLCRPVFDSKQRFQGIRASNRDITQRKQMELELRLHDAALKSCAEGIVITDVNANIQWVNPAFCELTGFAEAEVLGKTPSELVKSGLQDDGFYQNLWQTILSGQPWRGEIVNRRKNGELYDEQLSITPVFGAEQVISHFVAVKQDISERKRNQEQIQRLAYYDPLTQLANRRLLIDRLEKVLAICRRHRHYGALLFLDLDRFKPLNDRYGHDAGDQLLQEVAKRLKETVRQEDTVARLGGDEFVVVLVELDGDHDQAARQAEQVALKLHEVLANAYVLWLRHEGAVPNRIEYQLTVSIGISLFMEAESNANKILKQADIAMYDAKHQGRNTICLFH
jgi:diguanylate cyclase (GGDEF)-like protein/PAS domain S-box-containing protein